MTSTPTTASTSKESDFGKFGRILRKAGGAFGFDLAGLFEDGEGQTTEGFEGFAPTFRMESQLKGRSPSTLTYKAPKTPSRTAVFELAPKPPALLGEGSTTTVNVNVPGTTQEEKEPVQEKADRLLSSFIGEQGTAGTIGAMGVGRAQEYGLSNEEIMAKARAENLKFGETAARGLGIDTGTASYTGEKATEGALGMAAVERMRNQGLADEAIRSLAKQQGMTFGESAARALDVSPAQTYKPPIVSYASPSAQQASPGAIGLAGIQRAAAAQGITPQEAARRAVAQGTRLGEAASALLR